MIPCYSSSHPKKMPPYPGLRHSMELQANDKAETIGTDDDADDWAAQYQAYLDEKELEHEVGADEKHLDVDKDDEALEGEDWAVQYAKYCEEKEREFFESYKIKEG